MVATKRSKGMTPSKTHTPPMCRGISLHSKLRNAASSAPKRAGSWGSAMNASLRETRILRLYCLVIHGGMQGAARGKGKVNRRSVAALRRVSVGEEPLRFGGLQRIHRFSGRQTRAPAGLSGHLWNEDRGRILEPRSGDRIVPAGGRGNPPALDQSRLATEGSGDQEGSSRHHTQEIPLQPVSLQLRKELGRHL